MAKRTPEQQALVDQWINCPQSPKFKAGEEPHIVLPDTEDTKLWGARVAKALGIADTDLISELLNQISLMVGTDARSASVALAAVDAIRPRDGVEGLLAAQMAATHMVAMDMLCQAKIEQSNPEVVDRIVNRATKLTRTFAAQVETLTRYRNAGRQQVVVQHQHVAVTADRAAVAIGYPAGVVGDGTKLEEQAHAQQEPAALAYASGAPMLRPNSARDAVPVASGRGKDTMQNARRHPR